MNLIYLNRKQIMCVNITDKKLVNIRIQFFFMLCYNISIAMQLSVFWMHWLTFIFVCNAFMFKKWFYIYLYQWLLLSLILKSLCNQSEFTYMFVRQACLRRPWYHKDPPYHSVLLKLHSITCLGPLLMLHDISCPLQL